MGLQSIKWIMMLLVLILVTLASCNRQVAAPTLTLETVETVTPVEKPTQPLETPQPTISSIITPTIHQAAATVTPTMIEKEIPPMIEIPDDAPTYEPTIESLVQKRRKLIFFVINEKAIEEHGFEMKQVAPIFTAEQVGALEAYGFEKKDPAVRRPFGFLKPEGFF